jgi:V8-like Glu-specific endopeptidase
MALTAFPEDAICYIIADIPGLGEFQGSGAIIGPHTILTAAHLLYDAGTDATADKVSVYPGFTPENGTYNPSGAVPGLQSIHTLKVNDAGDLISAAGTQRDFAVINTSTDLSSYGSFVLDPTFITGDVVVSGYPATNDGNQSAVEGVVSQDHGLSDLDTSALPLSAGYSGGPVRDDIYKNGRSIPAVVGTVSTNEDAMKLTRRKVALIRHWIAADQALYAGGTDVPQGLVPQLDGTVPDQGDAATLTGTSGLAAAVAPEPASDADTADFVVGPSPGPPPAITGPVRVFHPGQGYGTDM